MTRDESFTNFLKQAFGAVETETTKTPRGVHRELRVGNSMLMVGESALFEVVADIATYTRPNNIQLP
jgi:uncharacterized glyoxalase superfamily protein PhnB